jgi:signal peptidase complex subunit 2
VDYSSRETKKKMSKISRKLFTTEIVYEEKDKPSKIDKWDWNAVKNALDDSTRKFLTSQTSNFKEDHKLMDLRLLISTIAVIFSLTALVYDYLNPFPKSKMLMLFCVIA